MCVCVLEILVLKIFFWIERLFWEIFVLIGSLVELYVGLHSYMCFSHFEKLFWKAVSTPPRYLAICRASQAFFLTQSRHLLDTWWIDRESSCLLLDSSLTPAGSIELLFLNLTLCCSIPSRCLSCRRSDPRHLPRYLSCRALLKVLYISQSRFFSHFFDLSRSVRDCSSPKHSPFHSKPLPQVFFKLFQVSPYLVSS